MSWRKRQSQGVEHTAEVNRAKTHCINGHPFTPENTKIEERVQGKKVYQVRYCLACRQARMKLWYERYKAKKTA